MSYQDPLTEEEMRVWAEREAQACGYRLSGDERQLGTVLRGLVRNRDRFGNRYCPCRVRSGDLETDRVIICPCIYRDREIAIDGHCHCNLFFAPEG